MQSLAPPTAPHAIDLQDEAATAALGMALARALGPGDTVFLRGALGAGKTALARAAIRALLGDPAAQVPSPSYTLVNLYETRSGPVLHVDLYRVPGSADELEELGLEEALPGAIVLIEWPERLGGAAPARRVEIALAVCHNGMRRAQIASHGGDWNRVDAVLSEFRA